VLLIRFLIIAVVVVAAVFIAARLGLFAGKPPVPLGIRDGKLSAPRGGYPNSVVSQHSSNDYHAIAPLKYAGDPAAAMNRLRDVVGSMNGCSIVEAKDNYLYAQFTTFFMRYIDDVEFMVDRDKAVIHVRSASRLGRKDFGVNRERVESIRRLFEK
jgi:uncharacterized protein (DUF1499 family)